MGFLTDLECRMERLSAACWATVARPREPRSERLEVVTTLRRVCDDHAMIVSRGRTVVPNSFVIQLPPGHLRQLGPDLGPLGTHLASQVCRYAAEKAYSFAGPVRVTLTATADLGAERYRIRCRVVPAGTGARGAGSDGAP